jgi:hypothetical protein
MHYEVLGWTNSGSRWRSDTLFPSIDAAELDAERLAARGFTFKQIDRVAADGSRTPVKTWPKPKGLKTWPAAE